MFVSQVVSSSSRNGGSRSKWSRKKKSVFGSFVSLICGSATVANSASATRSSSHRSDSPSARRKRIERCQRSPATSRTRIDADPSWRTTMSTPAAAGNGTLAAGRAIATMSSAAAVMRNSHDTRPPSVSRSRTGKMRRRRNARRSRSRATKCQLQKTSRIAGATSSVRNCGSINVKPSIAVDMSPFSDSRLVFAAFRTIRPFVALLWHDDVDVAIVLRSWHHSRLPVDGRLILLGGR